MKRLLELRYVVAATISLTFLIGCSGGNSTSLVTPVQAQTGYSNASITGTYSVIVTSANYQNYIGSITADGNGNITAGTLTNTDISTSATNVCNLSVTGTYSLQSNASGTATLAFSVASSSTIPSSSCATSGIVGFTKYIVQASSSGASVFLQPYNGLSIIASKQ